MYGIELLVEEHENILIVTKKMKKACVDILDGTKVNVGWFREAVRFCRFYADKYHHAKEEEVLFRIMMEEMGSVAEKLIRQGMLVEHDMNRFHILELEKALDEYEKDPTTDWKLEIITNASEYASLLQRHVEKENTVVYTFAERCLSGNAKDKVDTETKDFESSPRNKEVQELLNWLNKSF